jgi:hypothetical protein
LRTARGRMVSAKTWRLFGLSPRNAPTTGLFESEA